MFEHASINRIYRLVWDALRQTWIAVSEATRGKRKKRGQAGAALLLMSGLAGATPPPPSALPQGGQLVAGQASITQAGARMDIVQGSERAAINWQNFDIGQSALVNIQQPGRSSVLLNRVLDGNPSQIFGRLQANGQVFLVNPAGVYFSPTASVDVGALSVSTRASEGAAFGAGSITSAGLITAHDQVKLAAAVVRVEGRIDASSLVSEGGRILLVADSITLAAGSSLDARGATGGGEVLVGGGWQGSGSLPPATRVTMASGASIDASATQAGDGGTVVLWSDVHRADSATRVHGSIRAEGAAGGSGGRIETSGHWLDVKGARIHAGHDGQWLLDPYDVEINADPNADTGDDGMGGFTAGSPSSTVWADDITNALNNGTSVTVSTGSGGSQPGNITVNASITKAAGGDATLTLKAANSISVNEAISSSVGKLHVVLNADSDGNGLGAVLVAAAINSNGGNITLGGGANAGSYAEADGLSSGALGSNGITIGSAAVLDAGGGNIVLRGSGTGLGISVLGTVKTSGAGTIGLYGRGMASQASTAVQIGDTGSDGRVEAANGNITVEGAVPDAQTTGINLYSAASAVVTTGSGSLGLSAPGLFGAPNGRFDSSGLIKVGGDVNVTQLGSFYPSYGNDFQIGGVLNMNVSGSIGNVHSSGALKLGTISAANSISIDTLAGDLTLTGAISTADASDSAITLGAGQNEVAGTASGGDVLVSGGSLSTGAGGRATLYTGSVSGSSGLGALIGSGSGRFRYNSDTATPGYSTALDTGSYAIYREQPTLHISVDGSGSVSYGSAASTSVSSTGLANGDTLAQAIGGTPTVTIGGDTSSAGYATVGQHDATLGSIGADRLGYHVTSSDGSITVTARTISVSGITGADKTYDGTTSATLGTSNASLSGVLQGDSVSLGSVSGSYDKKDVGSRSITLSGLSLNGSDAGNYSLSATGTLNGNITPRDLGITGSFTASDRRYNGSLTATVDLSSLHWTGIVGSEQVSLGGSASFDNANAGTGKTVTLDLQLGGVDAGNYSIAALSKPTTTASITAAPLTLTAGPVSKTYNRTTDVVGGSYSISSGALFGTDSIGKVSYAYADWNVGSGNKTVSIVNVTVNDGNGGNNYLLSTVPDTASSITPAPLTLTAGKVSKNYDRTTDVQGGSYSISTGTLFSGDSLSGISYAYKDWNAGSDKTVSIVGATVNDGNSGRNYTLVTVPSTDSVILAAPLTLTAGVVSKTYDGNTSVKGGSYSITAGTLFDGDTLSLGSFAYTSPTAGTGNKTVTLSDVTASDGNKGLNYAISYRDNTSSTITAASTADAGNVGNTVAPKNDVTVAGGTSGMGGLNQQLPLNTAAGAGYGDQQAGTGGSTVAQDEKQSAGGATSAGGKTSSWTSTASATNAPDKLTICK